MVVHLSQLCANQGVLQKGGPLPTMSCPSFLAFLWLTLMPFLCHDILIVCPVWGEGREGGRRRKEVGVQLGHQG